MSGNVHERLFQVKVSDQGMQTHVSQKQNFAQSFETRKEPRDRGIKAQRHGNGLLCRNLSQLYIALTSSCFETQSEDTTSLPAKMSRRYASARIRKHQTRNVPSHFLNGATRESDELQLTPRPIVYPPSNSEIILVISRTYHRH